jgi:hypothetical protein
MKPRHAGVHLSNLFDGGDAITQHQSHLNPRSSIGIKVIFLFKAITRKYAWNDSRSMLRDFGHQSRCI